MKNIILFILAISFSGAVFSQLTEEQIKAYNSLSQAEKKKVDDKINANLNLLYQKNIAIAHDSQRDRILEFKAFSYDSVIAIIKKVNKASSITLLEFLVHSNYGGNENEALENYSKADTFYLRVKNTTSFKGMDNHSTSEGFYYAKNNYDYARSLYKREKFQESLAMFQIAAEYYRPDSAFYYAAKSGSALLSNGISVNKINVLNDFNKAIALNTQNDLFISERGVFYLNHLRDTTRAIADLTKAVQLNPKDAVSFQYLAIIQYYKSNTKEAISLISKSISIDVYNASFRALRGVFYQNVKEYQKAIDDYDLAIAKNKFNPEYYRLRAECNFLMKNYIDAYDDYGFVSMLDPKDAASKQQLQKLDPLLKVEYEKLGFTMQNAFQFFMNRADNQAKASEEYHHGRAVMNYYKCIQLEPKNPIPYNKAGKIFRDFKLNGPAEQFLRYAAYADGKNSTYFEDLSLYYTGLENFKSASGCLDTAILLGASYAAIFDLSGTVKYKLKDYEGAIQRYNKSLSLDVSHYDTKYMRAIAYMNLQNYKAALVDLEAVIKLEPSNQDYQFSLKKCKEMLK